MSIFAETSREAGVESFDSCAEGGILSGFLSDLHAYPHGESLLMHALLAYADSSDPTLSNLQTIVGAEPPPTADERRSTGELASLIEASTLDHFPAHDAIDDTHYDAQALFAAKCVIWTMRSYPHLAAVDDEELYREVKRLASPAARLSLGSLTGFMWGWAVNAARAVLELEPLPNPAIVDVRRSVRDAPQA